MKVKLRPPIDPETQTSGDAQIYTLNVYAASPDERESTSCPLGCIRIRPGPVLPGKVAAVHLSDGSLILRRIYYQRENGREFVRLESPLPSIATLRIPLSAIYILGTVVGCL